MNDTTNLSARQNSAASRSCCYADFFPPPSNTTSSSCPFFQRVETSRIFLEALMLSLTDICIPITLLTVPELRMYSKPKMDYGEGVKLDGKPTKHRTKVGEEEDLPKQGIQSKDRRKKLKQNGWIKRDYIGRKGRHIKYGAETEDDVIGKGREIGRK